MKKVREILNEENSFFTAFKQLEPDLYFELFEEIPPEELDFMLLNQYGHRYGSPLISYHKMPKTVSYIVNRYKDSWLKIRGALTAEYDLLKPYANGQTVTENTIGEKTDESNAKQRDGVYGFDSESAVDKSETAHEDSSKQNVSQTVVTVTEKTGNTGNYSNQQLILNEIELRKQSFLDVVIRDCGYCFTLDVY